MYSFYSKLPKYTNLVGEDTVVVCPKKSEIGSLLAKHNSETTYDIVFRHPTRQGSKGKLIDDESFVPLMEAGPGRVVAFAHKRKNNHSLLFPRIKRKHEFMLDLFGTVLPTYFPRLFPYSTRFTWREDSHYRLPNEQALLTKRAQIQREYEAELREIDRRIEMNREEYSFLHDLITQSGDTLVKTVETYLDWLGFDHVVNVDETEPELREEDLRIETERGLLVIEVQGIAGTSTDKDCSQISKIKYRRAEERERFDVFGLYLVNHQRFLPPENRANPPFNDVQIQDATNDKRGLLTTYDLFKLYFNISNGYISKEAARNALFEIGLVGFRPSWATEISGPRMKSTTMGPLWSSSLMEFCSQQECPSFLTMPAVIGPRPFWKSG